MTVTKESSDDKLWFQNVKSAVAIMVVLASALSLPYFRKFQEWFPHSHPAFSAILAGVMVAIISYPPMRYADKKYAFSSATLLGLLVAEFVVYGAPYEFPSIVAISFFFFMYYYGNSEKEHLWPDSYKGTL